MASPTHGNPEPPILLTPTPCRRAKRRLMAGSDDPPETPKAAKLQSPTTSMSSASAVFSPGSEVSASSPSVIGEAAPVSPTPAVAREQSKIPKARARPRGPRGNFTTSNPPAFVDHPVVIEDRPGGKVSLSKLGPWQRSQLISNVVGPIRSVRPLPSGKWLVGCASDTQQHKLARLNTLPGGIEITARCPAPSVEGVVGPIPHDEAAIRLIRRDLERDGLKPLEVTRLKNKDGQPSRAVRIKLEATTLPAEVWLGSSPFRVTPYAAPVRRCTRCQRLGHTKAQCRTQSARCARCGKNDHGEGPCEGALSCINCNGRHSAAYRLCPEVEVRRRANEIRSASYIPFSVALSRARESLTTPAPTKNDTRVDSCWATDPVPSGRTYAQVASEPKPPPPPGRGAPQRDRPPVLKPPGKPKGKPSDGQPNQPNSLPQPSSQPTGRGRKNSKIARPIRKVAAKKHQKPNKTNSNKGKIAELQYQLVLKDRECRDLVQQLDDKAMAKELHEIYEATPHTDKTCATHNTRLSGVIWETLMSIIRAKKQKDPKILLTKITQIFNTLTGKNDEVPEITRPINLMLALGGLADTTTETPTTCQTQ